MAYDVATLTDDAGKGPNADPERVTDWLNETARSTGWRLVSVYRDGHDTVAVWESPQPR